MPTFRSILPFVLALCASPGRTSWGPGAAAVRLDPRAGGEATLTGYEGGLVTVSPDGRVRSALMYGRLTRDVGGTLTSYQARMSRQAASLGRLQLHLGAGTGRVEWTTSSGERKFWTQEAFAAAFLFPLEILDAANVSLPCLACWLKKTSASCRQCRARRTLRQTGFSTPQPPSTSHHVSFGAEAGYRFAAASLSGVETRVIASVMF